MSQAQQPEETTPEPQAPTPDRGVSPAGETPAVPTLPEVPSRAAQDTQAVEGEDAMNLPPGSELIQKPRIQG
jgi:hypothetical protein